VIEFTTSTTDSVISYYFQICGSKERLMAWFLSFLYHTSLVLSSVPSSSLLSSSSVLVSRSLVTTMAEGCNCLRQLIVGTSLSLSKILSSLSSETSECVSAYNSYKIASSFRTLLRKATIGTKGS